MVASRVIRALSLFGRVMYHLVSRVFPWRLTRSTKRILFWLATGEMCYHENFKLRLDNLSLLVARGWISTFVGLQRNSQQRAERHANRRYNHKQDNSTHQSSYSRAFMDVSNDHETEDTTSTEFYGFALYLASWVGFSTQKHTQLT
jgi:hypothetical protein